MKPLLLCLLLATSAQAHVTLEQAQAPAGSSYKAVLRVGHGCEGTATHTLRVRVPAGLRNPHPMPKPGWVLETAAAGEGATEITWRASGREHWLADAHYDEFVLRGQTPQSAGTLSFQVLQLCEKGQGDWSTELNVLPPTGAKP